ncbi:MAG: preprotein translocase subunit SecE [Cyanobacteria bacterium SIG30]|nr:preprotein translocase subunit SecE [Cyanobacteria bacterium SIG30]
MKANSEKPIITYLKGIKAEWSKITWPQKTQIRFETFIVLIVVLVFTVAVYLLDIIFKGILGLIH